MEQEPKELYPGHAAELAKQQVRNARMSESNVNPLPGPLLDAFASLPKTIAGLTVRPLVHYDFVILRQLESPLLQQLTKSALESNAETKYTDDQGWEMIFQFTRPIREVNAVLAQGRDKFLHTAVETIGMSLGPVDVAQLLIAIQMEFLRAFDTKIQFVPAKTEGGDNSVFTQLPAQVKTASAGGSTTSQS